MVDERLYLNKDHTKLLSLNHQPSWALQPACLPGRSWLPNGHCCYLCCCSSQRHPTDSWRYPPKMLIGEAKSGLLKPMESSWSTVSMRMCRKSDHGTWTRDSLPGKRLSLPHHGCTAEVCSGTQHSTLMTHTQVCRCSILSDYESQGVLLMGNLISSSLWEDCNMLGYGELLPVNPNTQKSMLTEIWDTMI